MKSNSTEAGNTFTNLILHNKVVEKTMFYYVKFSHTDYPVCDVGQVKIKLLIYMPHSVPKQVNKNNNVKHMNYYLAC